MKNLLLSVLFIVLASSAAVADSSCSKYYPLEEGISFQYTAYNKKGKVDATTNGTVINRQEVDGETKATISMNVADKKGKSLFETEYGITCTGTGIKIDYESLFPAEMKAQYEQMGMTMEISGTDIEIPNELNVGDTLSDSNIQISMKMAAMPMNISISMTNRKVEAMESVTTPAGTFECVVISEQTSSKVMMANQQFTNRIWLSEGVGMVKQESYKQNGTLMTRSELTQFSR